MQANKTLSYVCSLLLLVLVLSTPARLHGQISEGGGVEFIVFIHTGPLLKPDDPTVKQIAGLLYSKGYFVREPDYQRNAEGPGVDYFDERAFKAAKEVAEAVNAVLGKADKFSDRPRLVPRRNSARNPPGYLGVWLF